MTLANGQGCLTEVIDMNNNQENKHKQQDSGKEKASQTSARSAFFAKRWTFPVIYLAASVLIVGLMYAKSQDAAPYDVKRTEQGTSDKVAGPQLPGADAPANATPDFMWPVGDGGDNATLTMGFYQENASEEDKAKAVVSYNNNTFTAHEGVDIGLKSDAPFNVVAAAKGTVKAVTEDPLMGHVVEIDHGNGYTTYYASLASVEVEQGANVLAGQTIAKSGNNRFEKSEKNHLHFEMRKDGVAIDPNSILPKKPIGDNAQSATAPAPATSSTSTSPAEKNAATDKANKDATTNPSEDASKDASKDAGTGASGDAGNSGSAQSTDTAPAQH